MFSSDLLEDRFIRREQFNLNNAFFLNIREMLSSYALQMYNVKYLNQMFDKAAI